MAFVKADRVQEEATFTGTGDIVLEGAYDASYRTFDSQMADGDTCQILTINMNAASEWEIDEATYVASTNSLQRTVLLSSSTGSTVSFTSGVKRVAMLPPASAMVVEDNSGNASVANNFTVGGSLTVTGNASVGGNLTVTGDIVLDDISVDTAVFRGATSGTTTVQANGVASGTLTLPAATDTLVGKATTDTLTNKTLTSPVIQTGMTYGGVAVGATPTGTANLVLSASPTLSGTVGGALTWSGSQTMQAALTYGGVTLSNSVTGTGSMVLGTSPQFTTGIGVGRAATSSALIATGGNIGGAASMYNTLVQGTIQSDVTGAYYGVWSQPSTAAASFTLNALVHYGAQFTAAGAGSTVANQYGFYVGSGTLTGATANYAFYGGLASGSGAYNLYMGGTAANYLGGATTFNAAITYGGVTLSNSVTGTGSMVLASSPTLTTPNIGAATGTSTSLTSGSTIYNATAIPAGGTAGSGYKFSSTANFGMFFGSGAPTLSAAQGSIYLRSDGVPYYNNNGSTGWTTLSAATSVTVGSTTVGSGTSGYILYNNAGTLGNVATTGSGSGVLATSPSLVTPDLGTPSAVSLTNGTNFLSVNDVITHLGANTTIGVATTNLVNTGSIGANGQKWEITGVALIGTTDGTTSVGGVSIHDGTSVVANGGGVTLQNGNANWPATQICRAVVTLTGATTFTLRGTGNQANCVAFSQGYGGSTNTATFISARRLT